jgi:hypothetical protein
MIGGNNQIRVNTVPEQRMGVKSVHMKHIPLFKIHEEIFVLVDAVLIKKYRHKTPDDANVLH